MTEPLDAKKLLEGTTPGPWRVQGPIFGYRHIYHDDGEGVGMQAVATVIAINKKKDGEFYGNMFEANAYLIAAAPDLARRVIELESALEQAREVLREVEWHPESAYPTSGINLECPYCDRLQENGHKPDCKLAQALQEPMEEK